MHGETVGSEQLFPRGKAGAPKRVHDRVTCESVVVPGDRDLSDKICACSLEALEVLQRRAQPHHAPLAADTCNIDRRGAYAHTRIVTGPAGSESIRGGTPFPHGSAEGPGRQDGLRPRRFRRSHVSGGLAPRRPREVGALAEAPVPMKGPTDA